MIPPRLQRSAGADELESLQTDVMRFFAILALCLVAIFPLVDSPAQDRAQPARPSEMSGPPPSPAARETTAVPKTETKPRPEPEPGPEPAPAKQPGPLPKRLPARVPATAVDPTPAAQQTSADGFTLAFASGEVLRQLLAKGSVRLFALGDGAAWQLVGNRLQPARPPASFYSMHAATVPAELRALATTVPGASDIGWAVTLPPETGAAIARLTAGAGGGELLIRADATVVLE